MRRTTIFAKKMNRSRIIGFAGRKRSGKSMLAKGVKQNNPNTVIIAVADNLKILCAELLNVTVETLNKMKDDGSVFYEKINGRWVSILNQHTGISDETIWEELGDKVFTNVREVLQVIGTDLIRKYTPNWHIDKTVERIKSIDESNLVVIEDIRFPNEKREIENLGGEVFFVMRPKKFDVSNHPSETALKYTKFCSDAIIINDLPMEEMWKQFQDFYFNEFKTPILLSENPWYCDHMIDMKTQNTQFNADRTSIIKVVVAYNKFKPQFIKNGIITFENKDPKTLELFRRIIMNDRRKSDGCIAYSIYNPITNEILKEYM